MGRARSGVATPSEPVIEQRLDKWLWAARFFKTRALATEAINGGKIHVNDERVKPARSIRVGDQLKITRDIETWKVTILGLNEQRRPAKEAVLLYQEDEHQKEAREQQQELRRLHGIIMPKHKPDKHERRQLEKFKEQWSE